MLAAAKIYKSDKALSFSFFLSETLRI